ncbi:MAG: dTDP-4-dehydrorhamnose reductase [Zavarzinella sp.]
MRAIIVGGNGQLGQEFSQLLLDQAVVANRSSIDLQSMPSIEAFLDAHQPTVVLNCAAYNFVDRAESEADAAFATNAHAVHHLAKACQQRGIKFVHFSTDHVFGGDSQRSIPYCEGDLPAPVSVYGCSKLAGEHLALATCPSALIIRTCGLYSYLGSGGKGNNFVLTMLRLAERKTLKVIDDQICSPTFAGDLAAKTLELLAVHAQGVFHITNQGGCSWWEFAKTIFEYANLDVEVQKIRTAEYGQPARRPAYSVLSSERLDTWGIAPLPTWRDAVRQFLKKSNL